MCLGSSKALSQKCVPTEIFWKAEEMTKLQPLQKFKFTPWLPSMDPHLGGCSGRLSRTQDSKSLHLHFQACALYGKAPTIVALFLFSSFFFSIWVSHHNSNSFTWSVLPAVVTTH